MTDAWRETEADWQRTVTELATRLGWRVMHVRRTIGKGRRWTTGTSVVGWPDLTLWHEQRQLLVFAELKADDGKVTPEQEEVLGSLLRAGQQAHVWRPRDFDDVMATLSDRRAEEQHR